MTQKRMSEEEKARRHEKRRQQIEATLKEGFIRSQADIEEDTKATKDQFVLGMTAVDIARKELGLENVPRDFIERLRAKYKKPIDEMSENEQADTRTTQREMLQLRYSRNDLVQFVREAFVRGGELAAERRYGVADLGLFLSMVAEENGLQYTRILADIIPKDDASVSQTNNIQYINNIPLVPLGMDMSPVVEGKKSEVKSVESKVSVIERKAS